MWIALFGLVSSLVTFKQTSFFIFFFFQEFPNNSVFNFKELDPNQPATVTNVAMLGQPPASSSLSGGALLHFHLQIATGGKTAFSQKYQVSRVSSAAESSTFQSSSAGFGQHVAFGIFFFLI